MMLLLSLLCYVGSAVACLQCDRSIRILHEDFILSAPSLSDQIELKKINDQAIVSYKSTSQERKGVIDPTTLYRAKTEYQSEFNRFLKAERTAIQIMEKGRKILEKNLDVFIHDGLCPNKCGLLKRRVMDCLSCQYMMYMCPSPSNQQDCGELSVQSEEGGQAVLDCFFPWHRLVLGNPEYHYSWIPGSKKWDENNATTLVVTDESSVILNQLSVKDQGIYRCSLQKNNGTIFSQVTFLLTVDPVTHQTQPPLPSLGPELLDTSPSDSTENLMLIMAIVFIALAVTACIGIIIYCGVMALHAMAELRWSQKKIKKLRRTRGV
ncbi:izumo sperm-egg fusion protein 1 isoform X2 [Gouania willdenowi]|uniref:izumo sperm-egg fusion protein 1 isoform X2 n=1 Tax=Gouania willdenowi TaxID=441366 RepID=UPI001054DF2C|nr:izumo sperm-egg fusion protein 1 isoform X2 [Gouania willdenowi]